MPKSFCTHEEKVKFKQLEEGGVPYDEIDKAIGGTPRTDKSKLLPTNIDYFVIRDCDFKNPSDAQYIRDNYADPKDGKVRRIPIWLTTGDISAAIPHSHKAFDGGSNVRAFSYYDGDNQMLKYIPRSVGRQSQKSDWVTIPYDNPDEPLPADAPTGIKFGGVYKVNIKGINGAGEIMVPLHSWYGIGNSIAVLRRVRTVLGRFNCLVNGEPFLVLEKVLETVKAPDGKRQKQWITTINALVDMADLAVYAENKHMRGFAALKQFNNEHTSTISTLPVAVVSVKSPEIESKETSAVDKEREDIIDALYKIGSVNGLTDNELEAYGNFKLRQPIAMERDLIRLKKLKAELDMRLRADKNTVKTRCQELLAVVTANNTPPTVNTAENYRELNKNAA